MNRDDQFKPPLELHLSTVQTDDMEAMNKIGRVVVRKFSRQLRKLFG